MALVIFLGFGLESEFDSLEESEEESEDFLGASERVALVSELTGFSIV